MGLHGVWKHSTVHDMDMDTDMDIECGTHGVWRHFTFHHSICTQIWLHVNLLSLLHILDIKIDLFKIGTMLFIIIQAF